MKCDGSMTASGFVNCFARIQRANRMMLARQWKERGTSRPISDSAHAPCVLRESYPLFNDFRYHKLRSVINSLR